MNNNNSSNNSSKLLWVVIGLTLLMIGFGFGSKFLVDKIADRVLQKLQKEYSPSPYGPGVDPDKLDAEKMRKGPPNNKTDRPVGWDAEWEKNRK